MRRATWILWLMLALLPLRGWAVASMGLPMSDAAPAVVTAAADPAPGFQAPCHDMTGDAVAGSACQACDWCHAAMGLAPPGDCPVASPPTVAPLPALVRDTGRHAVGGLERPPRSLLA